MTVSRSAIDADWLGLCRRAVAGLERMLAASPSTAERARETGTQGSGGDRTLIIDAAAEEVVFAELEALSAAGYRFHAISEERGEVDYGDTSVRVIIDPIDGSLNAKRGIPHHALSIAVADGDTMADVVFAFVYDFGPAEEWRATRGEGAWCNDVQLDRDAGERRGRDGRLEVIGIESADPRWVAASIDRLVGKSIRLRALGTIASSLCQVAGARFDAMLTLRNGRGVDSAAGQLIVREGGGYVSFPRYDDPLAAPLDAEATTPVIAARSLETVHELEGVPT
ncbi:MAG TPA: inositol monophosphatase family protein [Solirubrobacteraceae bacterium]|nr:inositol monophosphatase family protein [Solirubrobacteraceae bacterium]